MPPYAATPHRMNVEQFEATKFAFLESECVSKCQGLMKEFWGIFKDHMADDCLYIGFSTSGPDVPMDQMNFRMGVSVAPDFDESKCTAVKYVPVSAGRILTLMYKGPYCGICSTYTALVDEIKKQDYKIRGWPFEIYYNDPEMVAPEDILTKVCFQIE